MARFGKSGLLPQRTQMPTYGDFSNSLDFHQAQNRLIQARKDFMSLPSGVRKEFDNDPGQLVEFINDPENLQEAQDMGLLPKEPSRQENVSETKLEPKTATPEVTEGPKDS